MGNELKVFESNQFGNVRVVVVDNEPWFVATDVCRALELDKTWNALQRLDDDEKGTTSISTLGGRQEVSIINEPGLYSLVLGSRKPEAKAFKRWVTHEVIPAIRKTGGYIMGEAQMTEDELVLRAYDVVYRKLEEMQHRNALQTAKIAELEPKANYCDVILNCSSTVTVTQIAKDYGLSATALNRKLAQLGIQYRQGSTWIPYQEYSTQGYTQSQTYAIDSDKCITYTCWTQKGRMFLYEKLKSEGIYPLIEMSA